MPTTIQCFKNIYILDTVDINTNFLLKRKRNFTNIIIKYEHIKLNDCSKNLKNFINEVNYKFDEQKFFYAALEKLIYKNEIIFSR